MGSGLPRVNNIHIQALKNGDIIYTTLINRGLIEYIDINEENNALIALHESVCNQNTTHLEIEAFSILGVVAGLIPFPHHNQSPRNTYQCAMGKQAIGNIAYNQLLRMDTLLYMLCYSQKPLLSTKTIKLIGFDNLGAGQNVTLAVMSYSGYDIEDAIIMNKASLDRGLGRSTTMKSFRVSFKKYANRTSDILTAFGITESKIGWSNPQILILDNDGLTHPGKKLNSGDILIDKQVPIYIREIVKFTSVFSNTFYRSMPTYWKSNITDCCIVDQVMLTTNESDNLVVKVLVRNTRRPEQGDKFSSRHGQKGVLGNIVCQEDMPFSELGICPDFIMNPHGFPSRMTVGKMIELVGSKSAVILGKFLNGTAFGEPSGLAESVEVISQALADKGFSYSGKDFLTSGTSGEPLEGYIFMGPVYYQKLKHMVLDKIHARASGPRILLTRQPTEGRSHKGGLRLGEMERDCLISHGAAMLLLERLMTCSDQFNIHVCTECKILGYWKHELKYGMCHLCKQEKNIIKMNIPYACKLLFQEMQSMNIVPRIILSRSSSDCCIK